MSARDVMYALMRFPMTALPSAQVVTRPTVVEIPEGWFLMGSDSEQDNERPVHRVWVGRCALGAAQVTNEEYGVFLAATGKAAPPFWNDPHFHDRRQPVVGVSWYEALGYCEWLTQQTRWHYRLPTEAEWERAARGGLEGKLFPWGDAPPQSLPDYQTRWKNGPEPVRESPPNGFGLFEMNENVHEWCSDWFQADYYTISPSHSPQGPANGIRKSSRGGSWRHHIKVSRCAARSSIPPEFQYADYGFRVACEVEK
jgi:formylglycine-generating enzyme required for sulfatase activity